MEKIRRKLDFAEGTYFDPIGRSGGMAVWWRVGVELEVNILSRYLVHLEYLRVDGEVMGAIPWVYGQNRYDLNLQWWRNLERIQLDQSVP